MRKYLYLYQVLISYNFSQKISGLYYDYFFLLRQEIYRSHPYISLNSNCMLKKLIKKNLDSIMDECIEHHLLPPFMMKNDINQKKRSFSTRSQKFAVVQNRCKKFLKMLPTVQLIFC